MDDLEDEQIDAQFRNKIKVLLVGRKWEQDSSLLRNFFPVTTAIQERTLAIKQREYDNHQEI